MQQGKSYTRKPKISLSYVYNKNVTYRIIHTKVVTVNSIWKIYEISIVTITATFLLGLKKGKLTSESEDMIAAEIKKCCNSLKA